MNLDQTTDFYAEAVSSEGCISGSRGLVTVTVIQSPIADFTHTVNHQGGSWNVQFNNQSTSAQDYLWLFGDSATSSDVDPLHVYNQTTDYPVTLIAISSNGCSDTLTKTVSLFNNTGLFVPTTFTPNNDGKNDVFRVRGDRMIVEEMKIFSQWGTLLWQGNGAAAQWDGLSGGDVVPNGTYYYRIRVTENSGNQTELTGTVTVIK